MTQSDKIFNLNQLTDALNQADGGDATYEFIMGNIRFGFKDIEHLCFWDADFYSRINIASGSNYSLDLICWEKQQHSPIHNHEKDRAWFYILKGEITEKLYKPINGSGHYEFEAEKILAPRRSSHLNHGGERYHELVNSNSGRSVSLHLYVK
ncbi:MAG: cysteine dioxygenase family protein [Flavobacteriales bacterium]|nr:cysteine dioxygenase family protein [Flavobacteriales bacterium]